MWANLTSSRLRTNFSFQFRLTIGDRKSTRLNSSHLVISYAVFCLKKKRKHRSPTSLQGSCRLTTCGSPALARRSHATRRVLIPVAPDLGRYFLTSPDLDSAVLVLA